jgi:hypothetical protein
MKIKWLLFLGSMFVILLVASTSAKEYFWNGKGDNISWDDPLNWTNGNGYPTSEDTAIFPKNTKVVLTQGIPNSIQELILDDSAIVEFKQSTSITVTGGENVAAIKTNPGSMIIIGEMFKLSLLQVPVPDFTKHLKNNGEIEIGD